MSEFERIAMIERGIMLGIAWAMGGAGMMNRT